MPMSQLLDLSRPDWELGVFQAEALVHLEELAQSSESILVYGWRNTDAHRKLLEALTGQEKVGVLSSAAGSALLSWMPEGAATFPELSGMAVATQAPSNGFTFFDWAELGSHVEVLARLDGQPWFLRVRKGRRSIYLLAADAPDPDVLVRSGDEELPLLSATVAVLLYLRTHHPQECWQPATRLANFIVDDPLLRPVHGFLRHDRLSARVEALGAAVTIAFIPWNAHRTAPETARLYRTNPGLSLCVHGNDHVSEEFVSADSEELWSLATEALDRLRRHAERTRVQFDPVMVLPQSAFSANVFQVLEATGFLAAVASTFLTRDAPAASPVRLRDLVEPAVTRYGGVPLFRRRSARHLERFRYDLILGKPVFIGEHHQFFRDGGDQFSQLVLNLNRISPLIQWRSLRDAACTACLVRHAAYGRRELKFYTREFRYSTAESCSVNMSKRDAPEQIMAVTVDGRPVRWYAEPSGRVRFVTEVEREIEARVLGRPAFSSAHRRVVSRHGSWRVAARRLASELRDNYVHTSPLVSSMAHHLGRLLRNG